MEIPPHRRLKNGIRGQSRLERRHLSGVSIEQNHLPREGIRGLVIGDDSCAGEEPQRRRNGRARADFRALREHAAATIHQYILRHRTSLISNCRLHSAAISAQHTIALHTELQRPNPL